MVLKQNSGDDAADHIHEDDIAIEIAMMTKVIVIHITKCLMKIDHVDEGKKDRNGGDERHC